MSKTIKEQLEEVWVEEKETLAQMDFEKEKDAYKLQVNRVSELEKLLVDLEKAELDVDKVAAGQDIDERIKYRQIEEDKKDRRNKNIIEAAKIGVPVVAAFVMGIISMKWEKEDTLTSSAGKSALRDILKFK